MVIVAGAFVAQRAEEQIGGEGTLLIEKAGLPRAQIGADGNTEVLALVVVVQRELEEKETEEGQQLIVDLRYPWGGIKRDGAGARHSPSHLRIRGRVDLLRLHHRLQLRRAAPVRRVL